MIHRAKFENFKALRDVEVTFDSQLTVFVGPNGSGKTSVLRALDVLCKAAQNPSAELFDGSLPLNDVFSGDEANDLVLDARERTGEETWCGVRVVANPARKHGAGPGGPLPRYPFSAWHYNGEADTAQPAFGTVSQPECRPSFYPAELLHLLPSELAMTTTTQASPPRLSLGGRWLPSVLGYLKLHDEDKFDAIVTQFRRLIPTVRRLRVNRVPAGAGVYGETLLFDLANRPGVPASAMSDGTLYALGLLTVILGPQPPRVLLLDDIDHGLHLKAQLEMVRVVRQLLDQNPDLQIVATTHSLYILHELDPEQVRVMGLTDDGAAVCRPLADHPDFDRWKDAMSPGEFWSHAGEDWLTKPRVQAAAQ